MSPEEARTSRHFFAIYSIYNIAYIVYFLYICILFAEYNVYAIWKGVYMPFEYHHTYGEPLPLPSNIPLVALRIFSATKIATILTFSTNG
jgi:hypothetical protein